MTSPLLSVGSGFRTKTRIYALVNYSLLALLLPSFDSRLNRHQVIGIRGIQRLFRQYGLNIIAIYFILITVHLDLLVIHIQKLSILRLNTL